MNQKQSIVLTIALLSIAATFAFGHFQVIHPQTSIINSDDDTSLALRLLFTHPTCNGPIMNMQTPKQFGVMVNNQKINLLDTLQPQSAHGKQFFTTNYQITQPGDHIFYVEPAPYYEPLEQKMIVHYTKVIVNAFDDQNGWDQLLNLPVEIEPLTRPYGLWTGNLFQGIVRHNGQPVPFAEIEVEYLSDGSIKAQGPFTTQVIKADANGTFTYAMPRAGWWGFAALIDGENKINNPQGKPTDVELGGLIWVQCTDMEFTN